MLVDTKVSEQHCILVVDLNCLSEMVSSCCVVLLLVENVSKTPPGVVLPLIALAGLMIAFLGLSKGLVLHMLMTT